MAEDFIFAVPVWHCYGHTADCQRKNSGKVTSHCGLMDGNFLDLLFDSSLHSHNYQHWTQLFIQIYYHPYLQVKPVRDSGHIYPSSFVPQPR